MMETQEKSAAWHRILMHVLRGDPLKAHYAHLPLRTLDQAVLGRGDRLLAQLGRA